jgi:hypothetical protein
MNQLTKSCEERDSDILLLVHHDLNPMAALHLQGHLIHCDRCRRRREQFAALTTTFANATGSAHAGRLDTSGASVTSAPFQTIFIAVLALTILVSLVAAIRPWLPGPLPPQRRLLTAVRRPSTHSGATLLPGVAQNVRPAGDPLTGQDAIHSSGSVPEDGCTPGLPSDRCR